MTTYYRDPTVRVTDEWVEVGPRRLRIADLSFVWHQRGRPTVRTASRLAVRYGLIALLIVPVAGIALVLARLLVGDYGTLAVAGLTVVLASAGLTLAMLLLSPVVEFPMMALERSYDRGLAVREIWVRWRGQDLMLLRTTDAARFGRIYRAIERAVERAEE